MSPVEMRLEALKLAVGQRGNPNVIQEAEKFFEFINGAPAATMDDMEARLLSVSGTLGCQLAVVSAQVTALEAAVEKKGKGK